MNSNTVTIEHAKAPSFSRPLNNGRSADEALRVNVYVKDRHSKAKQLGCRGVTIERALEWAREYIAIDSEREIVIQPAKRVIGSRDFHEPSQFPPRW